MDTPEHVNNLLIDVTRALNAAFMRRNSDIDTYLELRNVLSRLTYYIGRGIGFVTDRALDEMRTNVEEVAETLKRREEVAQFLFGQSL